ncbi:MAG TPA: hypothetical protein PKX05_05010, partial [bacterium]|nr:hypothetical protein [bacterium]
MWDDLSDKIISEDNANIPDPLKDAKEEAERIKTNKFQYLTSPIKRIILDAPWIDEKELLVEVGNYYKESMSRIPSFAKYPEAKPWVEYIIKRDKEVMELANLTEKEMGVLRVMNNYLTFRGYKNFGIKKRKSSSEKCRIAFLPETDMGPMHIKNLDDPIESWQPGPPLPARAPISSAPWYHQNFIIDGVGSGLHIDDEPPEIFPLP